ncbi:MAG: hypothetical protein WBY44_37170 [Bryobacteraceae bacterium]|jgi:hypothetical protein
MSYVRWFGAAALAAGALWCAGCSNDKKVPLKETVEEAPSAPKLLSAVNMGDPKAEKQLLNGFYAIEANAWRWTAKDFSVALRPPTGSAAQGATLDFSLSVPQIAIEKLHSVTLSATINGTALAPETYSHEGEAAYKREIAPNLLTGDLVRVDFHLDKAMPPANGDMRQLGIIARSVALEGK